jgi:hypothetical protein
MRVAPKDSLAPKMEVETNDGLRQLKAERVEERGDREIEPSNESEATSEFHPNLPRRGRVLTANFPRRARPKPHHPNT